MISGWSLASRPEVDQKPISTWSQPPMKMCRLRPARIHTLRNTPSSSRQRSTRGSTSPVCSNTPNSRTWSSGSPPCRLSVSIAFLIWTLESLRKKTQMCFLSGSADLSAVQLWSSDPGVSSDFQAADSWGMQEGHESDVVIGLQVVGNVPGYNVSCKR